MTEPHPATAAPVPAEPGRIPWWIPFFNPVSRRVLGAGVPLGFNGLITIRGRTSGEPRTVPIAIIDVQGRRWVWSPYGETNWVKNLRAAGRARITFRRREEEVIAVELDQAERLAFFRDVLAPTARPMVFGLGMPFIRYIDRTDLDHPDEAAVGRPVFELRPADDPAASG